jgi:D-beta-D-heptose 7-phosphate kinase / D-beta-D-heptose 1-phosphate adenosyltransferase
MTYPKPTTSSALRERARGLTVWVLGDLMLDEYIATATPPGLPASAWPSAPEDTRRLGGAANVAAGVRALGPRTLLAGLVGDDERGSALLRACRQSGIETSGVRTVTDRPTTSKIRLVGSAGTSCRLDHERVYPAGTSISNAIVRALQETERPDSIVVSDYAKGVVTPPVLREVVSYASSRAIPIICDPKGDDVTRYAGVSVLTPNFSELERLSGRRLAGASDELIVDAARSLLLLAALGAVLVTLGERGMVLVSGNAAPLWQPALAGDATDATGAGDTVVAVLAVSLAAGLHLQEAVPLAAAAAAAAVRKFGTGVVSASEIEAAHRADSEGLVVSDVW